MRYSMSILIATDKYEHVLGKGSILGGVILPCEAMRVDALVPLEFEYCTYIHTLQDVF